MSLQKNITKNKKTSFFKGGIMSAEKISYELKRFAGIQRDYKPEEVERLRGSIKIEYSMCKQQSQKLWRLLNTEPYVNTLGSLSGNQAVQHAKAG